MFNPFKQNRTQQPFLSPLGRRRRLPAAAAPLAVTAIGGVALVVAFGALLGGRVGDPLSRPAAVEQEAAAQPVEIPPAVVQDTASPAQADTLAPPAESARAALTAPAPSIDAEAPADADPARTAAIVPEPISPPIAPQVEAEVPVAESEADIAALEAIQQDPVADDPAADPQPRDDEQTVAQAAPQTPALRGARVRQAVNLRAAPDNDGRVLMVVPGGAEVEAEGDCGWCAVRYRGSSGFVYKSFLDYR